MQKNNIFYLTIENNAQFFFCNRLKNLYKNFKRTFRLKNYSTLNFAKRLNVTYFIVLQFF